MSTVTKPIVLDETAQAIKNSLDVIAAKLGDVHISGGKFYGYKASSSALPSSGDEDGYAYVGTAAPYAIYNATSNNGILSWVDSGSTISNLAVADEEDIDYDANGKLQLANRAVATNQKGYKILRKGVSLASQMTDANTIYEVRYAFDLNGGTLSVPNGCILSFVGGALINGTLAVNNPLLLGDVKLRNIVFDGELNVPINARWYGCIPDYGTDDTDNSTALADCIAACESCCADFFLPKGNYYFSAPIQFSGNYNVLMDGTLVFGGSEASTAVMVGGRGSRQAIFANKFEVSLERETEPSSQNVSSYGLVMYNIRMANIYIHKCDKFTNNVTLCGSGNGFVYNKIYVDEITNGLRLLTLTSETYGNTTGWCNENIVFGGKYVTNSGSVFAGSQIGITITASSDYRQNGNLFIKPCVEGCNIGVDFDSAAFNTILGGRFEACSIIERVSGTSVRNSIIADFLKGLSSYGDSDYSSSAYFADSPLLITDLSYMGSMKYLCYDSGLIGYATDENGNTALNGFKLFSLLNFSRTFDYTDAIAISGDNLYLPSDNKVIALDIDTTVAKSFRVDDFGKNRLFFKYFDANGDVMSSSQIIPQNACTFNSSYNWDNQNSDTNNTSWCFRISNEAKKVMLIISHGTTGIFNGIKIYSDYPCIIKQRGDGIYLPSMPVSSRGVTFVGNSDYSVGGVIGWRLVNGSWVSVYDQIPQNSANS